MEAIEVIKSYAEEIKNNAIDLIKRKGIGSIGEKSEALKRQIEDKGFAIVPGFLTSEECDSIKAVLDEVIENNKKIWVDGVGSDHRIFFSNLASPMIEGYFNNNFIIEILSAYEKTKDYSGFTLANKLLFKENNPGSGGGWHRDFVKRKQTKALLYLNPVSDKTGPFQFLEGTHKFESIVKYQKEFHFKYNQNRFTDAEIEQVIKKYPEILFTVKGDAGTLILVDTRGIHRGKPIEEGVRYALTNYYWFNGSIPGHIKKLNPFV
jgi:hypothetical protein